MKRAVLLSRDPLRERVSLAVGLLGGAAATVCAFLDLPPPAILAAAAASAAMIAYAREVTGGKRTRRDEVAAVVRGDALMLGGKVIRRSDVANAAALPPRDGLAEVHLEIGWMRRRVVFEAPAESAHDLLAEWGVDAAHKRARFNGLSPWVRQRRLYAATVVGVILVHLLAAVTAALTQDPTALLLLFLPLPLLLAFVAPSRIEVGSEALIVRWLTRSRVIPYDRVERVEALAPEAGKKRGEVGVILHLDGGEAVTVVTGQRPFDDGTGERLLARIEDALARSRRGVSTEGSSRLARGARTLDAWLSDLRGLGAGARDRHRIAAAVPDDLARTLESAGLEPSTRLGAAVAWVASSDGSARERIRVAAQATASPELARALEAAADEDDAALGEAVNALEAGDSWAARRA